MVFRRLKFEIRFLGFLLLVMRQNMQKYLMRLRKYWWVIFAIGSKIMYMV